MEEQNLAGGKMEPVSGGVNMENKQPDKKSLMWIFVLLGVVVLAAVAAVWYGINRVYTKTASDKLSLTVAKALNLPALEVNGQKVPYSTYVEDLNAIHTMHAYDKAKRDAGASPAETIGADLTEQQMNDQVLERFVTNLLVGEAAKKYKLTVEDKDLQVLKDQMLTRLQTQANVDQSLKDRYGWTMSAFQQKVMVPFVLQTKLSAKLLEEVKPALKAKADQILAQLKKGGDFAALAKANNLDGTASTGGDLGWLSKDQMPPAFGAAAFSLKKGEVYSTVVEDISGFYIIKVTDKRTQTNKDAKGQATSDDQVHVSQINVIFPPVVKNYLDKAINDATIKLDLRVHDPFANLHATSTVSAIKQ